MNDDHSAIVKLLIWLGFGSAAWAVLAILLWVVL
jgi:hypothetical protein